MWLRRPPRFCPWPLLFTFYVTPVANIITTFGVYHHQFAKDSQLYITIKNFNCLEHSTIGPTPIIKDCFCRCLRQSDPTIPVISYGIWRTTKMRTCPPSVRPFIRRSVRPSIYRSFIRPSVLPTYHPSVRPHSQPSVSPSVRPIVRRSILLTCSPPFVDPSIRPSVRPSVFMSRRSVDPYRWVRSSTRVTPSI